MTHTTEQERADCPVCGGKPFIRRSHDADGMRWSHVECKGCGLRTRGKWVASSSDECPIFFQEVWEEWPRRAPAVPVPQGYEYDMIDRFLRNNLHDDDYAEYSAALDELAAAPQPPEAAPVVLPEPIGKWRGNGIYTEQQVRELLAAHGIEVAQ